MRKMGYRDIAKEAGVSFKTLYRVLNQEPGVKNETREKVITVLNRNGCVSDQSAPCHRCGRSESSSATGVVESLTRMSSSQRRKFTLFLR
ncbi:MAG: LacI family DNA-binding transcriptional regulator, partial [Victivallaceae bacterium]|nr:LacI family DNA-binding transcriptional regulator [Victivallaceae bacterium]